ncbi:hypothetical protein ES319_D12G036900v1 [Gossypium barbadense]|uniref:Uncharacterized protein n=2 Tax=Gossypium TaxID=3633 RepID=A0A5J5NU75_GOSBA|nr:hypothetical protein ES319_D12G036900v1 [Gossypium barbadense]TYG39730.1 hypothetical protein ES288_D12G038400v1 [Gossypium darwinii]
MKRSKDVDGAPLLNVEDVHGVCDICGGVRGKENVRSAATLGRGCCGTRFATRFMRLRLFGFGLYILFGIIIYAGSGKNWALQT